VVYEFPQVKSVTLLCRVNRFGGGFLRLAVLLLQDAEELAGDDPLRHRLISRRVSPLASRRVM